MQYDYNLLSYYYNYVEAADLYKEARKGATELTLITDEVGPMGTGEVSNTVFERGHSKFDGKKSGK